MRFFLSIAILLWASVIKTASSQTLSTIQGPTQGSPSISALPEDCLSPVDWHDIVFITAVPIAAGFGLLLLLAFLQDLRQACKSNRSCPPAPPTIRGNRARKERTYIIDVDYAGRSRWGSFLRWCATHKSSGANKNPRLLRLQGTIGFSDWLSFDLILGGNSEQKTITTPRSIGKLVAVEAKYPSASDGPNSRQLPSSNIGACLRGLINRACDIEIKNIHVTDAKTQDHYISGCGPSSGGISSSEQGITTILPLLLSTTQPSSRVNYAAYYFKHGSLWTSTFMPWRGGNFTGARHITCLFACISYTMVAVQVMSEPLLEPSLEKHVVVSPLDFDITMGMVIKATGVGTVIFPFLILMEILGRATPAIWSLFGQTDTFPPDQHGNFASNSQPTRSDDGNFNNNETTNLHPEGFTECHYWPVNNGRGIFKVSSLTEDTPNKHTCESTITSRNDMQPALSSNNDPAATVSDDICGDNQSICAANMLDCHHKFTCYKCPVCKRTTGSRYYNPGAGCSGTLTPVRYNLYDYGGLVCPRYAYSSSSLDSDDSASSTLTNATPLNNFSWSTSGNSLSSLSCSDWSESTASDSSSCNSVQPVDVSTPYDTQGVIGTTSFDHDKHHVSKQEAGDGRQATKRRDEKCKMKQDNNVTMGFKGNSADLNDANINSAKVLRTKNYINKFSEMGKGRVMSLPNLDTILPKDKFKTEQLTDIKSNLSASVSTTEPKLDIIQTASSDYIIDLPMEFEVPSVTIQRSASHKSFFFNMRKWLGGLRSTPKVNVGDDYKLKVTNNTPAIKTSDNNSLSSKHDYDEAKAGDHLHGSIFQSSSRVIEYQQEVTSLTSSGTRSSISSAQDFAERQLMKKNITNKNNSNEVTIIEMETYDQPSTSLPVITDSDAVLSIETSMWSSTSSIHQVEPSESASITRGDCVNVSQDISGIAQGMAEAESTTIIKRHPSCFLPILTAFGHVLLITSCVLAVLWSVSSVHGLCWSAFWEWVATSIIAVLVQVVILDTIKAGILTVRIGCGNKKDAVPKPHSLIY